MGVKKGSASDIRAKILQMENETAPGGNTRQRLAAILYGLLDLIDESGGAEGEGLYVDEDYVDEDYV